MVAPGLMELREISAILAGNAGDQSFFHVGAWQSTRTKIASNASRARFGSVLRVSGKFSKEGRDQAQYQSDRDSDVSRRAPPSDSGPYWSMS